MTAHKSDIENLHHIQVLVDKFYGKIREDQLLGPIFIGVIQDNWPAHLDKMYRFWQTVLLDEHSYQGSPFKPHAQLPVDARHFEQWLSLFSDTVDELFSGVKAEEAKWRAKRMATLFQAKIEYYKGRGSEPLL